MPTKQKLPKANPPSTFHAFPNLPPELQNMSWRYSLPGPRVIQAELHSTDYLVFRDAHPPTALRAEILVKKLSFLTNFYSNPNPQTRMRMNFNRNGVEQRSQWCESPDRLHAVQSIEALQGKGHIPTRSRIIVLRLQMDVYSLWSRRHSRRSRSSGGRGTGTCIAGLGLAISIVRRFGGFSAKESKGTLYNTMIPRMSNERATYCTIHQLFLIKTLRLTSPSDDLMN